VMDAERLDPGPVRSSPTGDLAPQAHPAPENQRPMKGTTLQCRIVITTPEGLHLRPLSAFAETAGRFQSRVTVTKDRVEVDGKSPLALMGLAAEQGAVLLLEVSGPDAPAALNALLELLASLDVGKEASDPPPA
jgi:phosphotransferase system HPr (HPr) family protein